MVHNYITVYLLLNLIYLNLLLCFRLIYLVFFLLSYNSWLCGNHNTHFLCSKYFNKWLILNQRKILMVTVWIKNERFSLTFLTGVLSHCFSITLLNYSKHLHPAHYACNYKPFYPAETTHLYLMYKVQVYGQV